MHPGNIDFYGNKKGRHGIVLIEKKEDIHGCGISSEEVMPV